MHSQEKRVISLQLLQVQGYFDRLVLSARTEVMTCSSYSRRAIGDSMNVAREDPLFLSQRVHATFRSSFTLIVAE